MSQLLRQLRGPEPGHRRITADLPIPQGLEASRPAARARRLLIVDGVRPWRIVEVNRHRMTIGRHLSCDIVVQSDDVSRYHAAVLRTGDGLMLEDLGSSNGTFVDCVPVRRSVLREGTVVFLGSAMLKVTVPSRADDVFYETLYEASRRDPLTGLPNRQPLIDRLMDLIRLEGGVTGGLVMLDIDRFKQINDTKGHLVGDQVLCHVADVLRAHTRAADLVARYGGDEFAIVVRQATPTSLERLCENLARAVVGDPAQTGAGPVHVRVSTGFAVCRPSMRTVEELVRTADERLLSNKSGRASRGI